MPTLLEKRAAFPAPPPPALLRSNHRWLHWRGALLAANIGAVLTLILVVVLGTHWLAARPLLLGEIWSGGVALTVLASLIALRFAPATLVETARKLDERYAAKNRLEAVALLEGSESPLALAQREETALHLKREPHARPEAVFPWLIGLLIALLVANLITGIAWYMPLLHHTPNASAVPPPAKQVPKASIRWVSPEAETKANPVEEVPTVAVADSTSGLQKLTLEVSLNGEPKKSTPIPAEPYNKSGSHKIKVSIYLDEIDAQPFDVVSYYLRGRRISDEKLPDVASAIQFIQVRPFRDDILQAPGHEDKGYALLVRLKLAQLRAIKENFILAHTDLPPDNPVRVAENTRVGNDQTELAKKTDEVVQAFIDEGISPKIIDLLKQAEPYMSDAGKKILATQNAAALPPQEKALDYIIQVEKYVIKAIGPVSPGPTSSNPEDPFKEKQKHELTKRLTAPAGQMEALASMQAHLSQDLNNPSPASGSTGQPTPSGSPAQPSSSNPAPGQTNPSQADSGAPQAPSTQAVDPFGPNAEKGSFSERQTRISQGVSVLLNGNVVFPKAVSDALKAAQQEAGNSLRQLSAGDNEAAREPAAAAARDLQSAVTAMSQNGDQETKQAMSDAQQKLNDLAKQLRDLAGQNSPDAKKQMGALADQMAKVEQDLNVAADHQQQEGSAKGAQQLAQLAEKLRQQQFASKLAQMGKDGIDSGRATALANQIEDAAGLAAHGTGPDQPSSQDYVALANALERTKANLERLAEKAGGHDSGPGQTSQQAANQGQGQNPSQAAGQHPGQGQQQTQTQGQGQSPSQTPSQGQQQAQTQGQGQSPSQAPGQGQGQGQGQHQAQTQGQGQSPSQTPGHGQGQDQGQSPSQTSGQGQGQGQGQQQAQAQGQGQGDGGQQPGGNGSGDTEQANKDQHGGGSGDNPGGSGVGSGNPEQATSSQVSAGELRAYREALQDLQNQTQQSQQLLRVYEDGGIGKLIQRFNTDSRYRPITDTDVVHFYTDLQKPLDALIAQLEAQAEHAQRTETVKAPNLDDTPVAYRSAVSDYFEAMSRDYHPPPATPPTPEPAPASPADNAKP